MKKGAENNVLLNFGGSGVDFLFKIFRASLKSYFHDAVGFVG